MSISKNDRYLIEFLLRDAYPVDDCVYMLKVPFHRPVFFQNAWDATEHPLYVKHITAMLVKIPVKPTSNAEQISSRLTLENGEDYLRPRVVKYKNYVGFFNLCRRHLLALAAISLTTLAALLITDWFHLGTGLVVMFAILNGLVNVAIITTGIDTFCKI